MKLKTVVAVAAGAVVGAGALYAVLHRKDIKEFSADIAAGILVRFAPMLDDPTEDDGAAPTGWDLPRGDHAPSLP
jgi:hypothetical protein